MEEALRIIIARSPQAGREAVQTLQAMRARSPIVGLRYVRALDLALADPEAQFTPEERQILADAVAAEAPDDGKRGHTLRIRMNDTEWRRLTELAHAAGRGMSEYVRQLIANQ